MKKSINKLLLFYYSAYVLAIIFAVVGYYLSETKNIVFSTGENPTVITLTSIYIIYLVASIPLSLKIFNTKAKKLSEASENEGKIKKYTSYSIIRLAVIESSLLIGILFYYLFNSQSMLFCAAIAAIALIFCKPSEVKMISELALHNKAED